MKQFFLMTLILSTGYAALALESVSVPNPSNWTDGRYITSGTFEHCSPQIRELFNKGDRLTSAKVNRTPSDEWIVMKVGTISGAQVISSASLEIHTWKVGFTADQWKCGEVKEIREIREK